MKNGVFWDITPCGSCHSDEGGAKFLRNEPHGVTSQDAILYLKSIYIKMECLQSRWVLYALFIIKLISAVRVLFMRQREEE
jgi:hypothetical protein